MKLQQGPHPNFSTRVRAVKHYQKLGSLNQVASSFNIHPITLRRWINRYKEGGEDNLRRKRVYKRHARRFRPEIEKEIVFLKEHNPNITLKNAQKVLWRKNIGVSIGGIWRVWRRYHLAGLREQEKPYESFETHAGIICARSLLAKGDVNGAANVLNKLPDCSNNEILQDIPDRRLSMRRQLDKYIKSFWDTPFPELVRIARAIRGKAEKRGLYYAALRAGAMEVMALDWIGHHTEQLALVRKLRKFIGKIKGRNSCDPPRRFEILTSEALGYSRLGHIQEALAIMRKCENYCKHPVHSNFLSLLAACYSGIGFHKRARVWLERSLEYSRDKDYTYEMLAANMALAGEYRGAMNILKKLKKKHSRTTTLSIIVNSLCALGQGRIHEAARFANQSLNDAKREAIPQYLWSSTLTLASCTASLGDEKGARQLIRKVVAQLREFNIRRTSDLAHVLLGGDKVSRDALLMPDVRLAMLLNRASETLKVTHFREAFQYASTQRLMGLFHRFIPFFSGSVNKLIAKGKSTGLPKTLIGLPVFQKDVPVYHLSFMGSVRTYRNNVALSKPTPRYASFLIHLCFKKKIELNALYGNFWRKSRDPRQSLTRLMFQLRKYLGLPRYTLFVKGGFLHFKGYITSDYQIFEATITRAKALQRAGQWNFARKEYIQAFKLVRGEPFKKMYDNWSEEMRRAILNELESVLADFVKKCLEHGNRKDAQKVFSKISKITPVRVEKQPTK